MDNWTLNMVIALSVVITSSIFPPKDVRETRSWFGQFKGRFDYMTQWARWSTEDTYNGAKKTKHMFPFLWVGMSRSCIFPTSSTPNFVLLYPVLDNQLSLIRLINTFGIRIVHLTTNHGQICFYHFLHQIIKTSLGWPTERFLRLGRITK